MIIDEIKNFSHKIHDSVIANRRHLHANPELSFQEYKTCEFVKTRLDEMNIRWQCMAQTGIVALIKGDEPSNKVIALRADIDALPITEANNLDYTSANTGVMHACGHDAHTASLLGTAYILQSLKNKFGGTIKLIFQPGEETLPGGASLMIKEGVLQNPKPGAIIGQHVFPSLDTGKIAIRQGKFMASTDSIFVTVRGKGGHGAQPHQNIDPVIITAHILVAMQQIVSRFSDPTTPSVLSFGKLVANGAFNIIPDEVYIEGTFRTVDENWRMEAHTLMKQMAEGIAASMGGNCVFNIVYGYPYLVNEERLTEQVRSYAEKYLGKENVIETEIWMAAEDFASYSQVANGCFYLLGAGNKEKGITSSLHTPRFNIDEDALAISTGLMAYIALRQLGVNE
ncbi:MAG TPA: M20 family metallopeptidase [Chitinophagaceae bacterium]|jgi:amidohydrolase